MVRWEGRRFQLKRYVTRRTLVVLVLFLLAASPLLYHWLDHTVVVEDKTFMRASVSHILTSISETVYHVYFTKKDVFEKVKKGVNNIEVFLEAYPDLYWRNDPVLLNPSLISFYVSGASEDVWWVGFNLEPPHIRGYFGLQRKSHAAKTMFEKAAIRMPYRKPYGSSSINVPPASDDLKYLFKASDSAIWRRIAPVKPDLK